MIDASRALALMEETVEALADNLWCRHYEIRPVVAKLGEDKSGLCETNAAYLRAVITIDPSEMEDEDDVLRTFRHEMIHVVQAEWEVVWNMIDAVVTDDGQREMLSRAYRLAIERERGQWENILDSFGLTPRVLAGLDVQKAAACRHCGRTWIASYPKGTAELECPECHQMTEAPA